MNFFLIFFAAVSVIHIIAVFLKKEKLRQISKMCIIPFLLAAYMAGRGTQSFFPVPALFFGWVGDILLIKKKKKNNFKLGLASFLLGHLCYSLAFLDCLGFFGPGGGTINPAALAVYIPLSVILGILLFRIIKPFRDMYFLVILYMLVIMAMSFGGLSVFIVNPGLAGAMVFGGCFLFMVSDAILSYYAFRKLTVLPAVLIMAFYILAQTGIVMGILKI